MFGGHSGSDMTPRVSKAQLRTERLALRDAIPAGLRAAKSLEMAAHAGDAIAFKPGTVISAFLPIRSEADLQPLMARWRGRGARLCVPAIIDKQTIIFRELAHGAALIDTGFGTLGPGEEAVVLDPEIMLVPLSAFDFRGHRIGYGAGYYDRAIDRLRQKGFSPKLIGIAFDCQEVAEVPAEPHDISLDAILTESGLRHFTSWIG